MCGIAGIATWRRERDLLRRVANMVEPLKHRGPDDLGVWADEEHGIGLAHRRLSIIDASPNGHQPMTAVSGRYVIVYNGEIYNFDELRNELTSAGLAPPWRGHSDTEVLLAAIDAWGFEATLGKAVGMFADGRCAAEFARRSTYDPGRRRVAVSGPARS